MKMNYWLISIAIGMVLIIVCLAFGINENNMLQNQNEEIQRKIQSCYPIVSAKFNSPDVIISVDSVTAFLVKAEEVNATVVYETVVDGYVVVDEDFSYAYNLPLLFSLNMTCFLLIVAGGAAIFWTFWLWFICDF